MTKKQRVLLCKFSVTVRSTYDGDAAVFARNHLIDDMGKQNPSLRMGSKYRSKFVVQMYNKFGRKRENFCYTSA